MAHTGFLVQLIERQAVNQNWEAVLPLLERLETFVPEGESESAEFLLYHHAYALLELNRHEEALESLDRLVELDGRSPHYRLLFADALIRAEEWDLATEQLQAGLSADPEHPGCLCALGWTLYQTGQRVQGLSFLEQALDLHPLYYPAHLDLGLIHAAEGQWEQSEAHMRAALEACPEDPEIRELLEAVQEGRSRAESERGRIRNLWAALRPYKKTLPPVEAQLLRLLRKGLRVRGATHLEILMAETLWVDFAADRSPRPLLDLGWAAAVTYASHQFHGRQVEKAEVAEEWGVTEAALSGRFQELAEALEWDGSAPRHLTEIEDFRAREAPAPRRGPGRIICVDFVKKRRLPE
jgi:tetratricopeptide (TPR) repeat protein